ncbi:AAA family ATPase (plasmid) [Mycoplasmatota bacterium]|nr:AAA family ATPase [Mycoplasmatota bacterium]
MSEFENNETIKNEKNDEMNEKETNKINAINDENEQITDDDLDDIFIHEQGICFTNSYSNLLKSIFPNSELVKGQFESGYLKKELIDKVIKKPHLQFVLIDNTIFFTKEDIFETLTFLAKESNIRIIYLTTEENKELFGKLVAYGIYDIILLDYLYGDVNRKDIKKSIRIDIIHQYNNGKSLRDMSHYLDDFTSKSVLIEDEQNKRLYKSSKINVSIFIDDPHVSRKLDNMFENDENTFNIKKNDSFTNVKSNDILLSNCDIVVFYNPEIQKLFELYQEIKDVDNSIKIFVLYEDTDYKKLHQYDINFINVEKNPIEQFMDILKTHIAKVKSNYESKTIIFKNKLITLTSKVGGVGVSTLSKELGGLFSNSKQKIKTVILDFSLNASSMIPLYGQDNSSPNIYEWLLNILDKIEDGTNYKSIKYSYIDVLEYLQYDSEKKLYLLPTSLDDFHILTEGRYENNDILTEALRVIVENVREYFEVVIIDTKGLTDTTAIACEYSTDIFVVTNDDFNSLVLNKAFISDLNKLKIDESRIKIIQNKHKEFGRDVNKKEFADTFKNFISYKVDYNKKIGQANLLMNLYSQTLSKDKYIYKQLLQIINDMVLLYSKKKRRK